MRAYWYKMILLFAHFKKKNQQMFTKFFLPLFIAPRLSTTPGQAGQHSMRLTGHGRVMKATPPSFGALTTAWAALGQKSFVKMWVVLGTKRSQGFIQFSCDICCLCYKAEVKVKKKKCTNVWLFCVSVSGSHSAMPTLATCLMMDQTQQDSASASTVLPSHLKPEKTTNLMRMSVTDGLFIKTLKKKNRTSLKNFPFVFCGGV